MPSDYIYNTQNYLEKTQKHNRKKKQYTTHTLLSLCSLSQSLLWIIKKINRCSLLSKIVALLLSFSPVLSLNRFSLSPITAMAFNCFFLSPMIGKAADLCTREGTPLLPSARAGSQGRCGLGGDIVPRADASSRQSCGPGLTQGRRLPTGVSVEAR